MRWLTNVMIWLALTAEIEGTAFMGQWETWLTTVGTAIFRTVLHVQPFDAVLVILLLSARRRGFKGTVPAVRRSIKMTFIALGACWVWGILRGGSPYQTIFQLHPFVMGLFTALLVMCVYKTPADIKSLGRTVVFACLYRSTVCILFYVLVASHLKEELPALTDHCDSVLFVGGLFVLIVNALQKRTVMSTLLAVLSAVPILAAIVLNNRRIAWLGVGIGFLLVYILLPKGKQKSRINYVLLALSPFFTAYVVAGWGHPTGIFKPVGSISTMFGENQDTSSIMRDIENYNLMRTLKWNPFTGFGWGREYIEEVVAFDISSIFPQYRYLPHNSLLGVIAFTGMFGFWGLWQLVVTTVLMHAKVYREARANWAKTAAMSSLAGIAIIEVQMWGDIGFNHRMVCAMLAITVGLAGRLPVLTKLWPGVDPDAEVPAPAVEQAGPLSEVARDGAAW